MKKPTTKAPSEQSWAKDLSKFNKFMPQNQPTVRTDSHTQKFVSPFLNKPNSEITSLDRIRQHFDLPSEQRNRYDKEKKNLDWNTKVEKPVYNPKPRVLTPNPPSEPTWKSSKSPQDEKVKSSEFYNLPSKKVPISDASTWKKTSPEPPARKIPKFVPHPEINENSPPKSGMPSLKWTRPTNYRPTGMFDDLAQKMSKFEVKKQVPRSPPAKVPSSPNIGFGESLVELNKQFPIQDCPNLGTYSNVTLEDENKIDYGVDDHLSPPTSPVHSMYQEVEPRREITVQKTPFEPFSSNMSTWKHISEKKIATQSPDKDQPKKTKHVHNGSQTQLCKFFSKRPRDTTVNVEPKSKEIRREEPTLQLGGIIEPMISINPSPPEVEVPRFEWKTSAISKFEPVPVDSTLLPSQFIIEKGFDSLETELLSKDVPDGFQPLYHIEYYLIHKHTQETKKNIMLHQHLLPIQPYFDLRCVPTISSLPSISTWFHINDFDKRCLKNANLVYEFVGLDGCVQKEPCDPMYPPEEITTFENQSILLE